MENTTDYILRKFGAVHSERMPIVLHTSRHGGLTGLWCDLGYRVGAEIGTEQGRFAEEICQDNPGVQLTCIDPYLAYDRYADHVEQKKLDRFYAEAKARLDKYYANILRLTSMDAVRYIPDTSLDFVFIDGNHHFDFVVQDIIAWAPKVRAGGMVAGHDYKPEGSERIHIPFGVIEAVNAYTAAHKISPWFVTKGDRCPSWFWVKK